MKNLSKKIALIILLILIALISLAILPQKVQSEKTDEKLPAEIQSEVIHTTVNEHAVAITKTIALIETGGTLDCSKKGLSGERGCHQFLPSTWASYSKEIFGSVVTQTEENATIVTQKIVEKFIEKGLSDRQIFLIWNQGNTSACKSGVNRHGVKYDSCAYVENALKVLQKVINTL